MTIRDEYEYLKMELMVTLADATPMCNLDFPFDFKISEEEENRYFIRGTKTRLETKKSMIILDNTYRKVRLFPSEEIAQSFKETLDGILDDYKKIVTDAFIEEKWRFRDDDVESFANYIDTLISRFKEAAVPYIETLKTLKQEDIEREIKAKDNLKKAEENSSLKKRVEENKKGLF
ncbi:MAG: hypothetical protein Q4F80_03165 [bacterium]|nr:hypothetical protein [bacterium]